MLDIKSKNSKNKNWLKSLVAKPFSVKKGLVFSALLAAIGTYLLIRALASPGSLVPYGTYTTWYWAEGKPMSTDDGLPLGVITIRRMSGPR